MRDKSYFVTSWVTTAVCLLAIVELSSGERTRQQFFRTRPQDKFVSEGGRAIISCVIGNLGGRVQWTKDGLTLGYNRDLPGFKRYSVVGTDESGVFNLQILNATLSDEAEYECQVGPNGTNKAIRETARLHVLLPPKKIEFLGYREGSQLVVQDGKEVELSCRVADAKPKPDIVWFISGIEVTKGRLEDKETEGSSDKRTTLTSTLKFRPGIADNLRTVRCEAGHPALPDASLATELQISVQYPPGSPEISGYTPGVALKKGDRVPLNCRSRGGNPPATLTWYKNGERIDSSYTNIKGGSSNDYEFVAQASDNNAVYSCHAKNELLPEPLTADIKLSVQYAPEKVDIIGPTEAETGDILSFECITSESNPPVDIWWVVDGHPIKGNHTRSTPSHSGGWITSTNTTVAVGSRDKVKSIQCHSINQAVKATKVSTHKVGVLYPFEHPQIVGYEDTTVLVGGQVAKIKCTAKGGFPLATLKWFHRNKEVYSEYVMGDNHASATLIITPNMTDNAAVYRCVATSRASEPKEASVRLSVNYAPTKVGIKVTPEYLTEGSEAQLECESSEANPAATVVWLHNGIPLNSQLTTRPGSYGGKVTLATYRFKVAQQDDGQVFTCKSTNEMGEALDAVTLSVAYPPQFPDLESPIEVVENSALTINLTARGNPSVMEYMWTSPSGVLLGPNSELLSVEHGILNITKASVEMAGTYRVHVNNSEGADQTNFHLDVLYAPRISGLTEKLETSPGDSGSFQCVFKANPIKYDGIRWLKQTENGLQELEESVRLSMDWREAGANTVNARLVIRNITEADMGVYVCALSNGISEEVRKETYLIVKSSPKLITTGHRSAAGPSETGRLVCLAQGQANITFSWKRIGADNPSGPKYEFITTQINPLTWQSEFLIKGVDPSIDYGTYQCTARNDIGLAKTKIIFQALSKPEMPSDLRMINVTGDAVELAWTPGFDGGKEQLYRVKYHRKTPGSLYKQPKYYDVYPMNSTKVLITGLTPASSYMFSIQALNNIGESQYTSDLQINTLSGPGGLTSNQPLVDGLTDGGSSTGGFPIIISVSIGVCGTLLVMFAVTFGFCMVHKRRMEKHATASRSCSSDSTKSANQDGLFNGSQGTSCYNDTLSEETMSSISEKSGNSFINPHDGRLAAGMPHLMGEPYRPSAASTYLTDQQIGGVYSVEQGREIGFTSAQLPLAGSSAGSHMAEDTESQYADGLRRQAYIQTLASKPDLVQIKGDQYNISAIGSSISYPNSPVNEYLETGLHNGHDQGELSGHVTPASIMGGDMVNTCPAGHFLSNSATLGRMPSARFGSRKSPFQVVIPGQNNNPHQSNTNTYISSGQELNPPACSTPQNLAAQFPILTGLASPNRNIGEFSTFGGHGHPMMSGPGGSSLLPAHLSRLRGEEPNGHLV